MLSVRKKPKRVAITSSADQDLIFIKLIIWDIIRDGIAADIKTIILKRIQHVINTGSIKTSPFRKNLFFLFSFKSFI